MGLASVAILSIHNLTGHSPVQDTIYRTAAHCCGNGYFRIYRMKQTLQLIKYLQGSYTYGALGL